MNSARGDDSGRCIGVGVDVGVGVQFDATHGYSISRSNNSNRMNDARHVGVSENKRRIIANYNNINRINNNGKCWNI